MQLALIVLCFHRCSGPGPISQLGWVAGEGGGWGPGQWQVCGRDSCHPEPPGQLCHEHRSSWATAEHWHRVWVCPLTALRNHMEVPWLNRTLFWPGFLTMDMTNDWFWITDVEYGWLMVMWQWIRLLLLTLDKEYGICLTDGYSMWQWIRLVMARWPRLDPSWTLFLFNMLEYFDLY